MSDGYCSHYSSVAVYVENMVILTVILYDLHAGEHAG